MTTINITEKWGEKEMKEAINDTLLTERCNEFTRKMLKGGMDINKLCMFVKDYQKKYLFMKQEGGDYKLFTMKIWWELGQRGDGKFALAK